MQFHAHGTTVILATHSRDIAARNPSAKMMRLEDGMITWANWHDAVIFRGADSPLDWEGGDALRR